MEAKLDIVEKCCGKEMQRMSGITHDMTVTSEDAYMCFECGTMISMKVEALDEEILDNYKDNNCDDYKEWLETNADQFGPVEIKEKEMGHCGNSPNAEDDMNFDDGVKNLFLHYFQSLGRNLTKLEIRQLNLFEDFLKVVKDRLEETIEVVK